MNLKITGQPSVLVLFITLILLSAGCKDFLKNQVDGVDIKGLLNKTQPELDSIFRRAGQNAAAGAGMETRVITRNLILGLRDSMGALDPEIQRIVDHFGSMSQAQLDSLGHKIEVRLNSLKDNIKDEELAKFFTDIIEESTGKLKKNTRTLLQDMINEALKKFDAETAKEKLQIIINGALGDSTRIKTQQLVNEALQPTVDSILNRIEKIVQEDLPFVKKQAEKLLIGLTILAVAIIGWIWYQRRRYARLVGLLTYQIDKIPSQTLYDELTKRIRNEAQKEELEPLLRQTLKEQGINT